MGILAKIAWRNIWRNPRRSWVLITALAVGTFSFLGVVAYVDGFSLQMVESALQLQGGHIQIARAGYWADPTIGAYIRDARPLEERIAALDGVRYARQARAPGMINSAEQSSGALIIGVDPVREASISGIPDMIVEGSYLEAEGPGADVVIGAALAERLNILLGEKVVLMANHLSGELSAGAYRVAGLYRTNSSDYDKAHIFLHIRQLQELVGFAEGGASAVTLHLDPDRDLTQTANLLRASPASEGLEVLSWRDRSPLLVMMEDMMSLVNVILVGILFSAIAFTLINSFIMVIFERIHEIGIMTANGVRPGQIRLMLYLEAVFIVILGLLAGSLLAFALIAWWGSVGLDLSAFAQGLDAYGAASVVYPHVNWDHIISGFAMIFVMVFLAVLYPAFKASRFETVEAIHYV